MKYKTATSAIVLALMLTLAVAAQAAVEVYEVKASALVPAFIDYKLNCPADVTISIFPSDAGGVPTGPAITIVAFLGQARGFHRYIWQGGVGATPMAWYVAEVSATSNQAAWNPIIGLYTNTDWLTEYGPRPLPGVPDTEGFYGIGINKNPASPYYGRIYVSHKVQKDIFMYGPDGSYLGKFNDDSIAWGTSAPWDVSVADDGYVYVCDGSNMLIHCFDPDGNYISTSPQTTNHRAIFARTTSDGRTHIFYSGGNDGIREIILQPDLITWTGPSAVLYNPGGADDAYGLWVSPDLSVVYQACNSGTNTGVTKWLRQPGGAYTKAAWSSNVGAAIDVDVNGLGSPWEFLWVTKNVAFGVGVRAIHKVNAATGATYFPPNADYDIVTWALMCCADGVGNIAVTFGKNTPTLAQPYWGLFAEAGIYTCATKRTTAFWLSNTPAPVVVPDSAVWTADNTIKADNTDSASVTFDVLDLNGWADITSVTLDLQPLGYGAAVACTIAQKGAAPKTVTATLTGIVAKVGARCTTSNGQPPHYLTATCTDTTNGTNIDDTEVELQVTGAGDPAFDAYVRHRRVATWDIDGAVINAVGGGIPGTTDPRAQGPFTYTSALTETGYASLEMSAGSFAVQARKVGFGSEAPISITVPYTGFTQNLYLRPLTIAECRATGNATFVNVEGVCYAQPVGVAPTAAYGLAARTDTLVKRNQWYVCDANDPANGMLFLITEPSLTFVPEWDDPAAEDMFGNSLYIGKRPAVGETTMITGLLDTPGGHERRVLIQDSEVEAAMGAVPSTIDRIYLNRGDLGGLPGTPVAMTIGDIYHTATLPSGFSESWGKFGRITGATVVAYQADGVEPGVVMTDPVPYLTIANLAGNKAQIAIDMPTTLNITIIPAIGSTYMFTGAAGRRTRFGSGALRVRSAADMVQTAAPPAAPGSLSVARTGNNGDPVNVSGIVTLKLGTSLWIEAADRSIGIRVKSNPGYIAVGTDAQVIGTLGTENGERVITPTVPMIPITTGHMVAAYDMRSREIGGVGSGTTPGVDTARGALNVGLKIHFLGMVTGIGAGNAYYYLWDGANRSDMPTSDGNADGFLGVKVEAAPPAGCAAWTNWVEVVGVVSTNDVSGSIIPTIKPISATKVTAYDTITAASGTALADQWNLMSVPAAPAADSDGDEWSPKAYEPYMVLAPLKTPDEIDGRMYRWENCSRGLYMWDMWSEVGSHGPFGGLLLGDGYWLQLDVDWPVSYSGKNSALDQWIGICNSGWMIIGQPKDHGTYLADVQVHDGGKVWTMYEAVVDNYWIDCVGYWWDNQNQGLVDVGIPDCWASTDTLVPWHGYWLQAYRGDLALIVPEAPEAP